MAQTCLDGALAQLVCIPDLQQSPKATIKTKLINLAARKARPALLITIF